MFPFQDLACMMLIAPSRAVGPTCQVNTSSFFLVEAANLGTTGHWYCLSSDLNPNWSSYFVTQPEIRAYWEGLHRKHGLAPYTVLNTAVVAAVWDADAQLHHITVKNSVTGQVTQTDAEILIWAIGGFMSPQYPQDIPGTEKFNGLAWHSARWRHDVDLKGKRVGVIGNGCSA